MPFLDLTPRDRKWLIDTLLTAFEVNGLRNLVTLYRPQLLNVINFNADWSSVAIEFMQRSNQHGVLDRMIAAAASERPERPDLRALALYFSRLPTWVSPQAAHMKQAAGGLESLTTAGDPFVAVARLARWIVNIENQVCQVQCSNDAGTGFLIGPDWILTCYHVVEKYLSGGVSSADVRVRFDYHGAPDGNDPDEELPWVGIDAAWQVPHAHHSLSDLNDGGPIAQDELDYAVLKLDRQVGYERGSNGDDRGWVEFPKEAVAPALRTPMLIVQHPERDNRPPPQMPLQIAWGEYQGSPAEGLRLVYGTSTKPGSSGAPVFDRMLNPIGLHQNKGQLSNDPSIEVINNRGVPLSKIRAHLPPKLHAQLTPPPK